MKSRGRRVARATLLTSVLSASLAFGASPPVAAVNYNDTNPTTTPCGDGTYPVTTWRSYNITSTSYLTGTVYARMDLRRSDHCNTVWTRVVNTTGSGTGWASARTLLINEWIAVYTCPRTSCLHDSAYDSTPATSDTLAPGQEGFSHQLVLPAGTTINGIRQPPTVRSMGWITSFSPPLSMDTGLEPVWTRMEVENESQEPAGRMGQFTGLSCENHGFPCRSWPNRIVHIRADSSLNKPGGPDLIADLTNVIVPAWNAVMPPNGPQLVVCTTCAEDIHFVSLAPGPGQLSHTSWDSSNKVTSSIVDLGYNHNCGSLDTNGCTKAIAKNLFDDRPVLSHELGHALGLMHCDLDSGVMCSISSRGRFWNGKDPNNPGPEGGQMFWTPQERDIWGLQAIYP